LNHWKARWSTVDGCDQSHSAPDSGDRAAHGLRPQRGGDAGGGAQQDALQDGVLPGGRRGHARPNRPPNIPGQVSAAPKVAEALAVENSAAGRVQQLHLLRSTVGTRAMERQAVSCVCEQVKAHDEAGDSGIPAVCCAREWGRTLPQLQGFRRVSACDRRPIRGPDHTPEHASDEVGGTAAHRVAALTVNTLPAALAIGIRSNERKRGRTWDTQGAATRPCAVAGRCATS